MIGLQDVIVAVPMLGNKRIKFNVTMLSQPAAFVNVCVATLLLVEYVTPLIHVIGLHEEITSVPVFELIDKCKVTTESHPAILVKVNVGVLVLDT